MLDLGSETDRFLTQNTEIANTESPNFHFIYPIFQGLDLDNLMHMIE